MDPLLAPIAGADHHKVGNITVDIVQAANGHIKRLGIRRDSAGLHT